MTGYAVFAKIVGADASSVSLAREEFGDDHQRVSALDGGATPLDVIGPSGYIPGYSSSRGAQALWLGRSVVIKLRNDTVHRYAFAAPHGWIVDDRNPSAIRIGRFAKEAADAPEEEYSLLISSVPIQPRQQIENLAAADFAQARPAVYDVAMDGRPAMFAVAFENGRVSRQAVYVVLTPPSDASPGTALVIRAGRLDPAVFSTLVSTLRFYDQKPKTTP